MIVGVRKGRKHERERERERERETKHNESQTVMVVGVAACCPPLHSITYWRAE